MHGEPPPGAPGVEPHTQRPMESQVSVAPQLRPHIPQFEVENAVSHHGLPAVQSKRPALQAQARDMQVALAPQLFVHEPQVAFASRLVSQPLESTESQLANPGLQDEMAHEPVEQVAVAFARVQVVPQVPQFVVVSSRVSQPFESTPSQFPQPELHIAI